MTKKSKTKPAKDGRRLHCLTVCVWGGCVGVCVCVRACVRACVRVEQLLFL